MSAADAPGAPWNALAQDREDGQGEADLEEVSEEPVTLRPAANEGGIEEAAEDTP